MGKYPLPEMVGNHERTNMAIVMVLLRIQQLNMVVADCHIRKPNVNLTSSNCGGILDLEVKRFAQNKK